MHNENESPPLGQQPAGQTGPATSGGRTIQPLNDMSEYVTRQASPLVQQPIPTQTTETVPTPAVAVPFDPTKIYPTVASPVALGTVPNANPQPGLISVRRRVASLVPSLQAYAILVIIYGLYSTVLLAGLLRTTHVAYSPSGEVTMAHSYVLTPILLGVFLLVAANIAIGVYLLVGKSFSAVSSFLTVLLILGGLNFLNTLISAVRVLSHLGLGSIVSLLISAGLLLYLWNVRSQVDLAAAGQA